MASAMLLVSNASESRQTSDHGILRHESKPLPEYIIERDIPGAGQLTEEQIRDVSLRSLEVLQRLGPGIQWMHSYVTDDRIYCVYLAPDEASIREHARQLGVPANRISAVRRLINPAHYA